MPLYEYQCDACGHRFEAIRKFSDAPLDICPKCGGALHKLQSAPAFHLKGSGWYITDYARKEQGGPGAKDGAKDNDTPPGDTSDKSEKGEKSEKSEKSEKNDTAEKSEKGDKTDKADKAAKSGSEPAAAPAKSDSSSAPSTTPSGSGPSAPTK